MTQPAGYRPWILLVDDEEQFAKVLGNKLSNFGFRVIVCNRIAESFTKLMNQKFDCILVDMHLQDGSGEKIISTVRKDNPFNMHTPILVLSGFLDADLVKKIGNQISGAVVKPFDTDALIKRILGVLKVPPT